MQDLKTGLFLADNDQTRRVLPQTSADIVEILSSAGEASNVQAEISSLRIAKLSTPAVGGSAGQVLSLDESGNTVWKTDEKGDTLPSVSSATAGQVLKVNSAVNGTEWGDVPKELPEQLGTSGQVLAVNSAASGVEWKTPEAGLPAIGSASAGDLLAVNSTADGVEFVKPAFYTKKNSAFSVSHNNWLTSTGNILYTKVAVSAIFPEIEQSELTAFCKKIIGINMNLAAVEANSSTTIIFAYATLNLRNKEIIVVIVTENETKPNNPTWLDLNFLIKN